MVIVATAWGIFTVVWWSSIRLSYAYYKLKLVAAPPSPNKGDYSNFSRSSIVNPAFYNTLSYLYIDSLSID